MRAVGGDARNDTRRRVRRAALGRAGPFLAVLLTTACASHDPSTPPPAAGPARTAQPVRVPVLPRDMQLVGAHGDDLRAALGQPSLVRSERQAQYWRYSLGGCQLDLFLYNDPNGSAARVVHLDVRPSDHLLPVQVAACAEVARRLTGGQPEPDRGRRGTLPPVETH